MHFLILLVRYEDLNSLNFLKYPQMEDWFVQEQKYVTTGAYIHGSTMHMALTFIL